MGRRAIFFLFLTLVLIMAVLAGCGEKAKDTSGTKSEGGSTTTGDSQAGKEVSKVYNINEKATFKTEYGEEGELTVTGVKTTNDLASPEAEALLNPDKSDVPNPPKTPGSGNEFLMITMVLKNTGTKMLGGDYAGFVTPASLSLKNAKGDVYQEVETNGHGGIFNAFGTKPGEQTTVTAIYEVPQGETGLTLTFEPWGGNESVFKIR